jgi:hypothetical protein
LSEGRYFVADNVPDNIPVYFKILMDYRVPHPCNFLPANFRILGFFNVGDTDFEASPISSIAHITAWEK